LFFSESLNCLEVRAIRSSHQSEKAEGTSETLPRDVILPQGCWFLMPFHVLGVQNLVYSKDIKFEDENKTVISLTHRNISKARVPKRLLCGISVLDDAGSFTDCIASSGAMIG
jgi:hypothetical protein